MHWTERQRARANLAHELMNRGGWKLYGYSRDQSDAMTDYYHPADWHGVALREADGALVVLDCSASDAKRYSGQPVTEGTREEVGTCETCSGSGFDPSGWTLTAARAEPERYHRETGPPGTVALFASVVSPIPFDGERLRCREPRCSGGKIMAYGSRQVDTWPTFEAPPGRANWCVIVGGRIVGKGVGMGACAGYNEESKAATVAMVDRWVALADRAASRRGGGSQAPTRERAAGDRPELQLNEERHGVELAFPKAPPGEVRQELKANGFRWSRRQGLWYARQTPGRVAFAEQLAAGRA